MNIFVKLFCVAVWIFLHLKSCASVWFTDIYVILFEIFFIQQQTEYKDHFLSLIIPLLPIPNTWLKKKKDMINPWPQLDKLRISSYSCNVLCLLSPKRKKIAYWHHYVIIIIIITIIDCQSILINSHLKSGQLVKYVNKLGSITNRCKKSQHLTVAIEWLREIRY